MFVYAITYHGLPVYCGQTKGPLTERLQEHIRYDRHGIGALIRRAGAKHFRIIPLAECESQDELDALEKRYIRLLQTLQPEGCNIRAGGRRGKLKSKCHLARRAAKRLRRRDTKRVRRTARRPRREQPFYPFDEDARVARAKQDSYDWMSAGQPAGGGED